MNIPRKPFLLLIRAWQRLVSPVLGEHCRFYPTCSEYSCQAIEQHGVCRGVWLTVKRLLRCHSLSKGGMDPVPKTGQKIIST